MSRKENAESSPFDCPKNYSYETISDYHLKKAEQLLNIKNYSSALAEFSGLWDCARQKNNTELAEQLEKKITLVETKLSSRNTNREQLADIFSFFSADLNDPVSLISQKIKKFSHQAKENEEYFYFIEKILLNCLEILKEAELFASQKNKIIDSINLILTFDPLRYLLELAKIEKNKEAFFLFDLDSTLFDNSPRVHRIIKEFAFTFNDVYSSTDIQKLASFRREQIVWGIKQNLEKMKITDEKLTNDLINFWFERFFSSEYIIDEPLKGADTFVTDLKKTGIKIMYLSGRTEAMREGTEKNLLEYGFPLQKSADLILKPDMTIKDHTFKHEILEKIKISGKMLAGFDNEPINTNIFQEHFPEARVFFLETNHSLNPPLLHGQIHTIRNFAYF